MACPVLSRPGLPWPGLTWPACPRSLQRVRLARGLVLVQLHGLRRAMAWPAMAGPRSQACRLPSKTAARMSGCLPWLEACAPTATSLCHMQSVWPRSWLSQPLVGRNARVASPAHQGRPARQVESQSDRGGQGGPEATAAQEADFVEVTPLDARPVLLGAGDRGSGHCSALRRCRARLRSSLTLGFGRPSDEQPAARQREEGSGRGEPTPCTACRPRFDGLDSRRSRGHSDDHRASTRVRLSAPPRCQLRRSCPKPRREARP